MDKTQAFLVAFLVTVFVVGAVVCGVFDLKELAGSLAGAGAALVTHLFRTNNVDNGKVSSLAVKLAPVFLAGVGSALALTL